MENYDVFWNQDPQKSNYTLSVGSGTVTLPPQYEYFYEPLSVTRGGGSEYSGSIFVLPTAGKKEEAVNTDQQQIDDAVAEALAKPRREAEIAKRVKAIEQIGVEDNHDDGTVLRWKRQMGKGTYTFAAIKVGENWYVTGSTMAKPSGWSWEALVKWMTQGESLIFDLEVATAWDKIL